MNFEAANTRFVERLGNYRVRTAGAFARKTNLKCVRGLCVLRLRRAASHAGVVRSSEEEGTAQDLLDLIKWRTVCHFFFEEVRGERRRDARAGWGAREAQRRCGTAGVGAVHRARNGADVDALAATAFAQARAPPQASVHVAGPLCFCTRSHRISHAV